MQPTKRTQPLAIIIGVMIYISLMTTYYLLFDKIELKEALLQALGSGILSGLIFCGLLKLVKKHKMS